jgi:hypothetical protein
MRVYLLIAPVEFHLTLSSQRQRPESLSKKRVGSANSNLFMLMSSQTGAAGMVGQYIVKVKESRV